MSAETTHQHVEVDVPRTGLKPCDSCGFEVPDNLRVCWKCGAVLDSE
ncbi:MAG: hypothetical protein NWE89_06340 [Candidatus Bathyarchaeota archaeon]|nr:hypothetical protein [Candidatus Bathyarchaeota archaeon]